MSVTVLTHSSYVMLLGICEEVRSMKNYKLHWNVLIYNGLSTEKTSNRKVIVRRKTSYIPNYMTAEYIGRSKFGHHCSEIFISIFVFFTPYLHQRISVFSHFWITLAKVCTRLPWFAATATLGTTIPWKIVGAIIIPIIFQFDQLCKSV